MQIAEVELLPETASKTVTDPARDSQYPQADGHFGQTEDSLVSATVSGGGGHNNGGQFEHLA